jgi:UDP-N-acetylglucosamine--N-acetylmuramyl-(pentapeptide) pyrophosphoryl-undecaprenol N-acetylglucosamine transferase
MRAILAGGGTGGHVIPALAIADELRSLYNAEILFVGTARGIENRLVPAAGYQLKLVEVGALKRVSIVTRLKTMTALPRAIMAASGIIREFGADVVIGVGGYASGPAMLAAALRRVPSMVFEPNVVPGFANKVAAPFAKAAAVHFEETCRYFKNCEVTGVPVRKAFFEIAARAESMAPSLLLFGGSQGARALNRALVESLSQLYARVPGLQITHQTGERELPEILAAYQAAGVDANVSAFINDMPGAFEAADLILCRSGASTVAEITAAGKAAIFVPFPGATDDHQLRNAETLAKNDAAVLIRESELTAGRLIETITSLLNDRGRLRAMGEKARSMSHPDAAARIARIAARLAEVESTPRS